MTFYTKAVYTVDGPEYFNMGKHVDDQLGGAGTGGVNFSVDGKVILEDIY